VEGWAKLPEGRKMGSTSAVDIDRDGKSVWVAERCGANSCLDRATGQFKDIPVIIKFDENGNVIKMFGAGMFSALHGIYVDRQNNIWVTDYQDNAPPPPGRGGRGAAPGESAGPIGPRPGSTKGHQVYKFNQDGKLLMTLGTPGGAAEPGYFFAPNDVIVAPNGDIFVSEGHGAGNNRILKFTKDGKLIKSWGKKGTGPGEFDQPHSLAFDSKGRLYVADRNNNRIEVFDQDGNYISELKQFSRPSGLFIDKHDNLYCADSESESVSRNHNGWKRGIRVGSLKDGKVVAFIPDPVEHATGTSAAEGVAVDAKGNIYGAEVGPMAIKKYSK
jgi:DNA-binding beta-propeller fold protein YncE